MTQKDANLFLQILIYKARYGITQQQANTLIEHYIRKPLHR